MLILGIADQQQALVTGDFESIATVTVGAGGTSTITFSSIPSTYQHLQIRATLRSASASILYVNYTFNNTGGTSYSSHYLFGNGATAGANTGNGPSAASMYLNEFPSNTGDIFGGFVLDILDYANTSKNTTTRALGGCDKNGSGVIGLSSGLFNSTNAVNRIDFTGSSGVNFGQYSHFALYGIRG